MTNPEPALQPRPRRLLGLDPGERRIGVAISDELGLYAHARPAILSGRGADPVDAVARIVDEEQVDEVVVGLPLTLAGADSEQTRAARAFVRRLRERLGVPVTEWDERLSSVQAAQSVKGAVRRRSGELDSAAAGVVLQAVLDARRVRAAR
jgi:putative Holliday junction resolvase